MMQFRQNSVYLQMLDSVTQINLVTSSLNHLIAGIFCFCGVALFPSEIVGELGLMRFFERGEADAYVP